LFVSIGIFRNAENIGKLYRESINDGALTTHYYVSEITRFLKGSKILIYRFKVSNV
jgi:hypothetical protein